MATAYGVVRPFVHTVDTSQDVPLLFTGQLAVATDYLVVERYKAVIYPGA